MSTYVFYGRHLKIFLRYICAYHCVSFLTWIFVILLGYHIYYADLHKTIIFAGLVCFNLACLIILHFIIKDEILAAERTKND